MKDTLLPRGKLLQGLSLGGIRKELTQGLSGGLAKSGSQPGFGLLLPWLLGPLLPSPTPAQMGWPGGGEVEKGHAPSVPAMHLYNVAKDSPLDQRLSHSSEQGTTGALVTSQTEEVCSRPRFCVSKEPPGAAGPSPPRFPRTGFLELAGCAGVIGTHIWVPWHWLCDRWNPHTESLPTPHTH